MHLSEWLCELRKIPECADVAVTPAGRKFCSTFEGDGCLKKTLWICNVLSWHVSVTTPLFATGRFIGEQREMRGWGEEGVSHHSVDFFETCLVCAH